MGFTSATDGWVGQTTMDIFSLQSRTLDLEAVIAILKRDLPQDHSLIKKGTQALRTGGHDEIVDAWSEVMQLANS